MEFKGTPTPWELRGTRIYEAGCTTDCIATMQVSNQPNWDSDAHLIAAAPKMYALLAMMADRGDNDALAIIKEINNGKDL